MLLLSSAGFFQNLSFQKILSRTLSECQMVRIQIRTDILLVSIWFQTICKGCQLTASLFLLSADYFFKINLFKIFFWDRYLSVKQVGSRSGLTKRQSWSGSKLFAMVISRRQKFQLARKELTYLSDLQEEQETSSSSDESDDEEDTARQKSKPSVSYRLKANGPISAVVNASDCRSRGRELDRSLFPYFRGDWSWNYFHCHSPPSADSRRGFVSYKRKHVLQVPGKPLSQASPGKSVARWTDSLAMTIAVVWDIKNQIKQIEGLAELLHLP